MLSIQQRNNSNTANPDEFPKSSIDINKDLTSLEHDQIEQLLLRNSQAFGYGRRQFGTTTLAEMTIEIGDNPLISTPPYHAFPAGREIINNTIDKLLELGVIEESDLP